MEKIKILGIAPYQEMEPLMRDIAKSYDNLELYTFTGFYKNAIQFAKAFPDKEFDVIVSRGGTADLVRSLNDTPVVKIKVSTLDLLRVITQALQCSSRAAVVSYSYITDRVEMLAKFLRLDIRTFSFETPEQIEDTVKQCARAGYDLIVGGAATRDYAVAEGVQFLLITSSRESVEASIQQAIEQHHLINDVLDMSKIESGKMQLAETEFELGEWLSGVVTVTQSQTGVRSQHFDVNVWNITHELLCGDTVRLGQVLTNVLGNAVKFTPKDGEIYLDITEVPSQDPSFASFVFRVSDTGVGMSREYMGRIFEMFSRDQNSYKQGIQGTGLGMAITKRIVDLMGGTIRVESEPGKGTTFTIGLSIRLSSRHVPLAAGCAMLVIGEPGSEEKCRDAVEKLEEIGVDAAWETDYQAAVSLAAQKRAAGRPFSMAFLPYKMLRFDRTLTGEQLKRDLGGDTLLLLGLKPDEQELFEEIKQKGFKYTISLPLFRMSLYRKITGMLGQGESISGGLAGELKGVRLLVVEDNAVNLEIAVEMLSGLMGAAVDTARNGEEGCTRFLDAPEDTYDVILMDLQMPVLGGLDAARRIRESIHPQAASIPIIALTANAFEEDRREALEAGMNGFVPKPIDFAVLAKEIGRVRREGRCLRLLLAEDNELNREIAAELIRADGQQVDAVENGRQALEAYLNAPDGTYDAILLDLRMPVMDGFEAAAAIRSSQRKSAGSIPVFAFTSSSEDEVRSEAARAGFGAVLTKPINMEQLRGLLG